MRRSLLFLICFLAVSIPPSWVERSWENRDFAADEGENEELILWNVGQGLWITWRTRAACHHFDAGGEHAPWPMIRAACGNERMNLFHFSHWDADHINFAHRAVRHLRHVCVAAWPAGRGSARKLASLSTLPACAAVTYSNALKEDARAPEIQLHGRRARDSRRSADPKANEQSRVFVVKNWAVAPGDSTSAAERVWSARLDASESRAKLLILGHHGSRTSTSETLLSRLPELRQAAASARKARYGHPHKEVVQRLKSKHIALIGTEDWGTIRWQLGKRAPAHAR